MLTLIMESEEITMDYSPVIQWRLNEHLEGAYFIKYGTADISWKKIDSDSAKILLNLGCQELAPYMAGPGPSAYPQSYRWVKVFV